MKTIGMTTCIPTATAHRPSPVTRPPTKLMIPIMMSAASGHGSATWIAMVESIASAKPKTKRPRFLAPGRRKIGNAGRYGAQRRRLARRETENLRGDERDHDHAGADAYAVDDVLTDKKPQEIRRTRPARHWAR